MKCERLVWHAESLCCLTIATLLHINYLISATTALSHLTVQQSPFIFLLVGGFDSYAEASSVVPVMRLFMLKARPAHAHSVTDKGHSVMLET